jgi:hypothetical protein
MLAGEDREDRKHEGRELSACPGQDVAETASGAARRGGRTGRGRRVRAAALAASKHLSEKVAKPARRQALPLRPALGRSAAAAAEDLSENVAEATT